MAPPTLTLMRTTPRISAAQARQRLETISRSATYAASCMTGRAEAMVKLARLAHRQSMKARAEKRLVDYFHHRCQRSAFMGHARCAKRGARELSTLASMATQPITTP